MSDKSHVSKHRPALQSAGRAVYDTTSGDIVHFHQTLWRAGREAPAAAHVDAEARRLAVKIGGRPERALAVVAADLDKLDHRTGYAVDLKTKKLVKR
jgi:hypothetical protein